jgi:hypothetical protein
MKISLLLLLTKVGARDDTGIDDIRRFFIVPATDSRQAGIWAQKWNQERMGELKKKYSVQYMKGGG